MRKWMVAMVMAAALAAPELAHANFDAGGTTAPAASTTMGGTSGLLFQNQLAGASRVRKRNGTPSWLTRGAADDPGTSQSSSGRLRRMARSGAGGR